MSEEKLKMNLMQKIAKARVLLQKKNLKKSGLNKYAGFKYFELADFLPSVNEIFDNLGLYAEFYIEPGAKNINEETGVTEVVPDIAYLYIYNSEQAEKPRCFMSSIAEAGTKGASPIQQLGSVHTYMRRYLYMEALEIVESDCVESLAEEKKEVKEPKPTAKKQNTPKQTAQPQQVMTPADMAVELTQLRGDLTKVGIDVHSDGFIDYIKKAAHVESADPGDLLGDASAMYRVIQVMRAIKQSKA